MASKTLPTSPLLALSRLESHPPSSENPIACIVFKAASTLSSFSLLSFMSSTSVCIRVHLLSGLFPVLILRLHQIGFPQASLLLRGESGVDARLWRHFRDYFEV